MHGSIELRRRSGSGSGLLRSNNDVQDRGARGFFELSVDGNDVAAPREPPRKGPPRRRQQRALVAAVALFFVVALVVVVINHHHWQQPQQQRPRPRAFSFPPEPTEQQWRHPPPSALCSPADASTRLEFFSDLGGFSFPTATAALAFADDDGKEEDGDESTAAAAATANIAANARRAQKLIDQGWLLYRGFHRSAAAAAFAAALEASGNESSGAALGLSWSLGPGANLVAVDRPVPFPAFEADRDFPLASEAARVALELAERADAERRRREGERQRHEEKKDDDNDDGDDDDDKEKKNNRRRLRRLRSFLVQRDLALAKVAAARFAPGTSRGRARRRAEAEAAVAMEEVARRGGVVVAAAAAAAAKGGDSSPLLSLPPPSGPPPLPDPALLSLAAELHVHESQWDYWELPSAPPSRDDERGGRAGGARCDNADCLSFFSLSSRVNGQGKGEGGGNGSTAVVDDDDATGWPSALSLSLKMRPHAERAAALVREALRIDRREPLALHLAVHLAEASPPPLAAALGLSAADALAGVVRSAGYGEDEGDEGGDEGGGEEGRGRSRWRRREDGGGGGGDDDDVPREALAAAEAAEREGTALLPIPSSSKAATPWARAHVAHLLHMPVHLYTRVGAYRLAVSSGIAASRADDALASRCIESYAVEHNAAALVFAANLAGRRKISTHQIKQRLSRSSRVLGPAMRYAEGTVEVTLGLSTEVLFADWGAIRERRREKELEGLEAEVEAEGGGGKEQQRWSWRLFKFWGQQKEQHPPLSLPSSDNERGLCVSGGAAFARAMFSAASALELAAAADKEARGKESTAKDEKTSPSSSSSAVSFKAADAAVAAAERLASSLPPEPPTRPGGGPGIYACGHREVAEGVASLARARLVLARGGGGETKEEKEKKEKKKRKSSGGDDDGDGNDGDGGGASSSSAAAAAAAAAARVLERHERLQFLSAYMEPPRSQIPLAPCLGYLFLRSGDHSKAAEAFRRDLALRPSNGRGLLGLALALEGMAAAAEEEEDPSSSSSSSSSAAATTTTKEKAKRAREAFERVWRGADAPLSSPCPALSD